MRRSARQKQLRRTLDPAVLSDIIERIVQVARPQQVVLFGSAVRGELGPNSDLDLLVVKSGRFKRGRLAEAIYRNLHGAGQAVDIVVVTPKEVEQYRNTDCLIIATALRTGRVVYAA